MKKLNQIAIIPARMQPPHLGHFNLLANMVGKFKKTLVLIYDFPLSEQNPFTSKQRQKWLSEGLRELNDMYNLKFTQENLELIFLTAEFNTATDEEIQGYIHEITEKTPFTIISLNPKTLKKCSELGFETLKPTELEAKFPLHPSLLTHLNDHGTQIRSFLEKNEPIPTGYLPKSIKPATLKKIYQKNQPK